MTTETKKATKSATLRAVQVASVRPQDAQKRLQRPERSRTSSKAMMYSPVRRFAREIKPRQ